MTTQPLHQHEQAPGFGGDLQRHDQAPAICGLQHSGLRRPFPGRCDQRSLLAALEELTEALRVLTTALVGEAPVGQDLPGLPDLLEDEGMAGSDAPCSCPLSLQQEPLAGQTEAPLSAEEEAQIVAEATDPWDTSWDTPWESLSVVELRGLLRDLPIDRSALPAPIEYLRRHELLDALLTLPATDW